MTEELLLHHRYVCRPGRPIRDCVIEYGVLCERAGYPEIVRSVGHYLLETARWCSGRWPPINSLAVNRDSRMPGESYDVAPGCSLLNWPDEAQAAIDCVNYPEHVSDMP